jgi:hypothetical protein
MKTDLKIETEKLTQRTDREIQNPDVVLRRQGEHIEEMQLEVHQESVS